MKKLFSFLFLACMGQMFAQTAGDTANYPYWWSMMQDRNVNFYSTQSAFEKYWANRPYASHSGYKVFKRWEYFWQKRVNPDGTFPAPDRDMVEYKKFVAKNSLRSANGNFIEMGPKKLPTNSTGQPNGLGRVNCIAFHPTNANTFYIGAPQGGVWKTTDAGVTWTNSGTDNLPSLGASAIAIDSANPNIMYLGTGDRDAGDAAGIGVYKSTNAGASWSASNSGMGNVEVARILINPLKNTTLLAATSAGVYKSYNSGANWYKKTAGSNFYKEMCFRPGDTSTVYATQGGLFYKSTNGGETWTNITTGFGAGITRMVIGVTKANNNNVYVICSNSSRTFQGFYVSTDNGSTFTLKSTTPNILGYEWNGSDGAGQAEYDIAMCINPTDANNILIGGINVWESANAGTTWTCVAHWTGDNLLPEIHADQHIFEINPLNGNVFFGNDGGIYRSTDFGTTYTDISSGAAIAQIYRLSQNPINPNSLMNGYQDNGTSTFKGAGNWNTVIGGDGMECIIDPIDTTTWYGSLYYGDIRRKIGAGGISTIAKNGTNGITEQGAWVTPYALQPFNNSFMAIGYKNVWRSNNVRSAPPTWTRVSSNGGANIVCVKFGAANNKHFYYYRNSNLLFRTTDITAATPIWDSVSTPINVESIETHPTDPNRIYICGQNKVYKSNNRGNSWTDISTNLPSTTMNHLVMDKFTFEGLYVCTDVGVYYKDSTMTNWMLYNTNMPVGSQINEAEIYYHPTNSNLSRISVATYGRGTWQSDLAITQTQPVVNFTASDTIPCTSGNVTLNDITSPASDSVYWTITPATFSYITGNANSKNPVVKFNANGNYTITLFARKMGYGYNTVTKTNYIKVGTSVTVTLGAPSKNNFCVGDSAQITATSANATNFLWSPGNMVSDSTAATTFLKPTGNTTFVVRAYNGSLACGDTESVVITVKPAPSVNVSGITSICVPQSTILTATGANTYTWSPNTSINTTTGNIVTVNPTSNITYTVSGTGANGCIGNKAVPITVTPRPKITISGNTTICSGGTGTVLTANGAGNYVWFPPAGLNTAFGATVTANPVNNFTYQVAGSVSGCFDTASVTIKVVPNASVSITADKNPICLGDSTNLNLKGCITYNVTPNANTFFKNDSTLVIFPTANTTYSIEGVITPTCKDTKPIFVTINPKPIMTLTANKNPINAGDTTTLRATGASIYTWSPSTGLTIKNDSTVIAKPTDTTLYKVSGSNAFNCSTEKTIRLDVVKITAISNLKLDVHIYPTPVVQYLNVDAKEALHYEVFNLQGKKLLKGSIEKGLNTLDLSALASGEYLLKLINKNHESSTYKLIKGL